MAEGDLVESKGKGKIASYSAAHVELDGKGNFVDLKAPKIIGAIKLDDADSTIFLPVVDSDAKKLKVGAEVSVVWSDQPKGEIADIKGFKP